MIVSPSITFEETLKGFHRLTKADPDQAGAALVSYYLLRGHKWADSTALDEAIDLVEEAQTHLPDLAPELRGYLLRRARIDGHGFSVADVGRVQWYRRRCNAWADIAEPGALWPGSEGWQWLRLTHLRDQGWDHREIANVLQLRTRTIRERLTALDQTVPAW